MALDFVSASSQYLDGGTTDPLTALPFSIAFRINIDSSDSTRRCPISKGYWAGGPTGGFWVDATATAGKMQASFGAPGAGSVDLFSASTLTAGTEQSVLLVYTSSDIKFYFDGVLDASPTHSQTYGVSSSMKLFVGAENTGSNGQTNHMDGHLSEIALYDAELTLADAVALTEYSPALVRPGDLVRHWPLVGNTLPEVELRAGQTLAAGTAPSKSAHPRVIRPSAQIFQFPAPTVSAVLTGTIISGGVLESSIAAGGEPV